MYKYMIRVKRKDLVEWLGRYSLVIVLTEIPSDLQTDKFRKQSSTFILSYHLAVFAIIYKSYFSFLKKPLIGV